MTNVLKSHGILRDNVSGGCFVVAGKVLGGYEHDKLTLQTHVNDNQLMHETIADAETVLKHSIGRGRDIIAIAQSEAKEAIEDAREKGHAKGYDEGLRQGFSEGVQCSLEERQPLVDTLALLSQKFSDYSGSYNKYEYLDKAIELTRSIIIMELEKSDDVFFALYKKAALHISNVDKATLNAGPRGYAAAVANKEKFQSAIEGLEELTITLVGNDDGLCVLETPLGNIDASVDAQLLRAKNIIMPQS